VIAGDKRVVRISRQRLTAPFGQVSSIMTNATEVVVGRARDCTVVIDDDRAVAPHHANIITYDTADDCVLVVPLDGDVHVNGQLVAERETVSAEDSIWIGNTALAVRTFVLPPAAQPERTRELPPPRDEPSPLHPWRDRLADDRDEHELLAALRARPGDVATRAVYADWLEQHGDLARADFVREDGCLDRAAQLARDDVAWRAIVSRARIDACPQLTGWCLRWWDALAATKDERIRRCKRCTRYVRYCADTSEVRGSLSRAELVVLDLAVAARTVDAGRIDVVLRASVPSGWRVDREDETVRHLEPPPDVWWTVTLPGGGIIEQVFHVTLEGELLGVSFGGSDAGMLDLRARPRHRIVELSLPGLDDIVVRDWLADVFAHRRPSRVGYT
jgi:uncharacterized protein (TIGR02996 family)